jgi:hypothetical protein
MRNRRHRSHCWKASIPYSSGSASYTLRISRAQAALARCAYSLKAVRRGRRTTGGRRHAVGRSRGGARRRRATPRHDRGAIHREHRRLDSLEQRVEAGFREVLGHFNAISRHLGRLQQEYAIFQALRRIEALLAEERGRREILERNLAELKREVTPQARSASFTSWS